MPWNIVAYNVFGGEDKGPEIFGTEPWTFYIRNLLLNFNIWFVLAMLSAPLLLIQAGFRSTGTSFQALFRSITLVAPFYMWFAIFTVQPHKEERFMYPAYPFLALNAALAFHTILSYLGSGNPKELIGRVPAKLKLAAVMAVILVAFNAGMLRILGMVTAYNAPLKVFEPLQQVNVAETGNSVCFGKEWYRFPSSYFLPHEMRAKFVRSEFRGLLPGDFPDAPSYLARLDGASQVPSGMNDLNIEDPSKYVCAAFQSMCSSRANYQNRLTSRNALSWWTLTSPVARRPSWNLTTCWMNPSGSPYPVRASLIHLKRAYWVG